MLDATVPVRAGEELPLETLAPYVRNVVGVGPDALVTVEQFPGGHSNLTYLVRVDGAEYVLRRPPFGSKVKSAHDMGREVAVLSKLAPRFPWAPRPLAYCENEEIIGSKFYLMQRLVGVVLRRKPPAGVVLDAATARRLSESFVAALAELHSVDPADVGLGDFGKPAGYVERQVSGWTERYRGSQTDDIPDMEAMAAWLASHQPPSGPGAVIHNDFKFDNLLLDAGDLPRIVGILDWEMATVGDALMDLGTALCYWVQADDPPLLLQTAFGPTALPGFYTRRQLIDRYAEMTGRDLGAAGFYYRFGLFKTAVVAQQIYYRFKQGLTKDARFAGMIDAVRALARQAVDHETP